jgi:hypothetical protein
VILGSRIASLATNDQSARTKQQADDLRRHRRHECIVTPVLVTSGSDPGPFEALVLDVSESGFRVKATRPLWPGCQVSISFADAKEKVLDAEGRFCNAREDGTYEIGFEIRDPQGL